jgi:hypothetical protein
MNKKIIMLSVISVLMGSCTDATISKIGGYGDTFTVKVLGPDTIITYHSTGKVISENGSDGYYFNDRETGKLIEVSGTVIIEQE